MAKECRCQTQKGKFGPPFGCRDADSHPDFRYQLIGEPEELGNGGRIQWVSGQPGEAPAYAGTDFIIARDGRIAALYLFFDKLP